MTGTFTLLQLLSRVLSIHVVAMKSFYAVHVDRVLSIFGVDAAVFTKLCHFVYSSYSVQCVHFNVYFKFCCQKLYISTRRCQCEMRSLQGPMKCSCSYCIQYYQFAATLITT